VTRGPTGPRREITLGCPLPVLRFLAREHARSPYSGPVLTLGRQCVYATFAQVVQMLREEGLEPRPLPAGLPEQTDLPGWRDGPYASMTSARAFFHALGGLEALALDHSDYEQAEIIWDLNRPLPAELEGRFGLVLDGGTLEHVFDTRVALANVARMLAPGGRVLHTNPTTNYAAHGFYQFSPTFYYDWYAANGFTGLRALLVEQPPWSATGHGWRHWEWNPRRPYTLVRSKRLLMTYFVAEKGAGATHDRIPQQGDFTRTDDESRTHYDKGATGWRARLVRALPPRLHMAIRRARGRDLSAEPWGLKYLGRL